VFIARSGSDSDLIKCDPVVGVLLPIVLPELFKLEVLWPYDLSKVRSKLFQAGRTMLGVVFNATDVLISLTIISAAEDAATGVMRRELLVEVMVEVLIHFLISITMAIAVVILTTMTTSVSSITVAIVIATAVAASSAITAAATASRVDWGWTMLVTWVF
jgi:hypothetical protein